MIKYVKIKQLEMCKIAALAVALCFSGISVVSAFDGQGTPDLPYIINSADDWNSLMANDGNDFTGKYLVLTNNISLPSSYKVNYSFNGFIKGYGHTLSLPSTATKAVFASIGKNGRIEDVVFSVSSMTINSYDNSDYYGVVCNTNHGLINRCSVDAVGINISFSSIKFGVVCGENLGEVSNTDAIVDEVTICSSFFGGICCLNSAYVLGCSVSGKCTFKSQKAGNNAYAGGIAYKNSSGSVISHCLNDLNFSFASINYSWSSVNCGGICMDNLGLVSYSVNKSDIISPSSSSTSAKLGGVSGNNSGEISNCVNRGGISSSLTSATIGGIVADGHKVSTVRSCIFSNVISSYSNSQHCRAVVGWPDLSQISNCYYLSQTIEDENAIGTTDFATAVRAINSSEHRNAWCVSNMRPKLSWEIDRHVLDLDILCLKESGPNSLSLDVLAFGDFVESGLQFRKYGTLDWTDVVPSEHESVCNILISGLESITPYEVRVFAQKSDGTRMFSKTQCCFTSFSQAGTSFDPITIGSYEEFCQFVQFVNKGNSLSGKVVRLTDDINMLGAEGNVWNTPIRKFDGEFDGDGHYIFNLRMKQTATLDERLGLFWFAENIHDLNLYDVHVEYTCNLPSLGAFKFGVLAGSCTYVDRCSVVGDVTLHFSTGSWNSYGAMGGISGYSYSMCNCYALLKIVSDWDYSFGGLAGDIGSSIRNSYYSDVTNGSWKKAKYIVGLQSSADISGCYYLSGSLSGNSIKGINMSETQMTDGTLFLSLPEDDWKLTVDNVKLYGGYPLLNSQRQFPVDRCTDIQDISAFNMETPESQKYWPESDSDALDNLPVAQDSPVENYLDIPFFTIAPGCSSDFYINLNNPSCEVYGLQFDCCIPDGLTIGDGINGNIDVEVIADRIPVKTDDSRQCISALECHAVMIDSNRLRVMLVPNINYNSVSAVSGTDGAVLRIGVKEASEQKIGMYYIKLSDAILVNRGGTAIDLPDRDCVFYCKYSNGMQPDTDVDGLPNALYLEDGLLETNNNGVLSFGLKNAIPLKSISYDIQLPLGISPVILGGIPVINLDGAFANLSATVSMNVNGLMHIVIKTQGDDMIPVNAGHLLDIEVNVSQETPVGESSLFMYDVCMGDSVCNDYILKCEKQTFHVEYGEKHVLPGDVNNDGVISITDAVGIVNFVIKSNTEGLNVQAADANGDSVISISDAVWVVNTIVHTDVISFGMQYGISLATSASVLCPTNVDADAGYVRIPVSFDGNELGFTAVKLDVELPDGVTFSGVRTDSKHILATNVFDGNRLRILCLSLSNELFDVNAGPVLDLSLRVLSHIDESSVNIVGIELVTPDMHSYFAEPVSVSINEMSTGFHQLLEQSEQSDIQYDIVGRSINTLINGIYIDANRKKKYNH